MPRAASESEAVLVRFLNPYIRSPSRHYPVSPSRKRAGSYSEALATGRLRKRSNSTTSISLNPLSSFLNLNHQAYQDTWAINTLQSTVMTIVNTNRKPSPTMFQMNPEVEAYNKRIGGSCYRKSHSWTLLTAPQYWQQRQRQLNQITRTSVYAGLDDSMLRLLYCVDQVCFQCDIRLHLLKNSIQRQLKIDCNGQDLQERIRISVKDLHGYYRLSMTLVSMNHNNNSSTTSNNSRVSNPNTATFASPLASIHPQWYWGNPWSVTPGSSPVPSPMPSPVPASPYGPAADSCIWICALRKLGNGDGSTVHEIAKLEAILLDALIIAAYVPSTSTPRTPPHMESPSSSSSSPSIPPLPPSLSSLSAASSPANRMITPSPVLPATSLSSPYHPKKEELFIKQPSASLSRTNFRSFAASPVLAAKGGIAFDLAPFKKMAFANSKEAKVTFKAVSTFDTSSSASTSSASSRPTPMRIIIKA
ncbi:MAG: hypothetical protein JOS17DRAFT_813847 [Linnemannia elongata]|nr:MAG: hypothetical protein JOS17DRAFT_813847 [Linnemannia elongata]